jgi:hypothetical protein
MNGKVKPVGELVPPLVAAAAGPGQHPQRAARDVKAAHTAKALAVASPQPASHGGATGYALAGAAVAAAGLGLGGLVRARRRMRPGSSDAQ